MNVVGAVVLGPDELVALTGYRQPAAQLSELLRQGYHRARRSPVTGRVILERAHYEAVASGMAPPATTPRLRPAPALR